MKKLFFLLVLAAIAVGVVGFYQGWFALTTTTTVDGKQNVGVTVDKDKIKSDEAKAEQKAKDIAVKAKEKAADTVNKVR
jgi:hypothetical protein